MFFQNRPSERLSSLVAKGVHFQRLFDKAKNRQKYDKRISSLAGYCLQNSALPESSISTTKAAQSYWDSETGSFVKHALQSKVCFDRLQTLRKFQKNTLPCSLNKTKQKKNQQNKRLSNDIKPTIS